MGDCGGEESPPGRVGGKGRSMRDGRLRTSLSFLDDLCGGVDFFGLTETQNTKCFREKCNCLKETKNKLRLDMHSLIVYPRSPYFHPCLLFAVQKALS